VITFLFTVGAVLCFARSVRHFRKAVDAETGGHLQAGNWLRVSGTLMAGAGIVLLGVALVIWRVL
jgi:hypothetical protein